MLGRAGGSPPASASPALLRSAPKEAPRLLEKCGMRLLTQNMLICQVKVRLGLARLYMFLAAARRPPKLAHDLLWYMSQACLDTAATPEGGMRSYPLKVRARMMLCDSAVRVAR